MGKRMRTVLVSMLVVCLCLALVVGGTYALFSDSVNVKNHLSAGSLKVGLNLLSYETCTLDDDGMMKTTKTTMDPPVDLVKDGSKLFQMTKAVPGSWYKAELEIYNKGDVAFDYRVRMLWNTDGQAAPEQEKLAGQIQITITDATGKETAFMLDEASDVKLGRMTAKSEATTFTVKAEFVDTDNNNDVQEISLEFDLQVYAEQAVVEQ